MTITLNIDARSSNSHDARESFGSFVTRAGPIGAEWTPGASVDVRVALVDNMCDESQLDFANFQHRDYPLALMTRNGDCSWDTKNTLIHFERAPHTKNPD